MGDISRKGRSPLLKGGRVGFGHGKIAKYESKVEPFEITPLIGPKGGGGKLPVKGTKIRKEYADLKKAHHTKTKILKKQEVRKELAKQEAGAAKLEARHPGFKEAAAKTKYAKYIKRHEEKT